MKSRVVPAVGIDLGGTSLSAAVVDVSTGTVLAQVKRKTRADLGAGAVCGRIVSAVRRAMNMAETKRVAAIGVGVPGPVDPTSGVVIRCPNLGGDWDRFPLAATLSRMLSAQVTIDNDVNVGAVGELSFGAGRGTRNMIAIFVGTGIGGGIIIDGKLYGGQRNSAGEVGHMVVMPDGPLCGCGQRGHVEALASRTAMERDLRAAVTAGRPSVLANALLSDDGVPLGAGAIGDALEAGDALTIEIVERAQYYLGLAVAGCVNLLDPELVVLGGGVLERMGDAYLARVRDVAQQHYVNNSDLHLVRIARASLGDSSGTIGAAVLAAKRLA